MTKYFEATITEHGGGKEHTTNYIIEAQSETEAKAKLGKIAAALYDKEKPEDIDFDAGVYEYEEGPFRVEARVGDETTKPQWLEERWNDGLIR